MAHLVEHLVFGGTDRLGTVDWAHEAPHLEDERDLTALLARSTDEDERRDLEAELRAAHDESDAFAAPNEVWRLLDRIGATEVNALTDPERTEFVATLPPEELERWAVVTTEVLDRTVFREFSSDRAIVEHELALRAKCQGALQRLYGALFPGHPYGRPVGGSTEDLARIDLDAVAAFHDRFYDPANAAVVLVGDVGFDDAQRVVRDTFGGWTSHGRPPPRALPAVVPPSGEVDVPGGGSSVLAAFAVVDPEVPPEVLRVLGAHLADAASHARFGLQRFSRGAALTVGSFCGHKGSACVDSIRAAIREALAHPPDRARIRAMARRAWVDELRVLEDPSAQAEAMVEAWARGDGPDDAWAWRSRIRSVRPEDVAEAARAILGPGVAIELPGKGPKRAKSLASAADTDVDRERTSAFYEDVLAMPVPPRSPRWLSPTDWTVSADGRVVAAEPEEPAVRGDDHVPGRVGRRAVWVQRPERVGLRGSAPAGRPLCRFARRRVLHLGHRRDHRSWPRGVRRGHAPGAVEPHAVARHARAAASHQPVRPRRRTSAALRLGTAAGRGRVDGRPRSRARGAVRRGPSGRLDRLARRGLGLRPAPGGRALRGAARGPDPRVLGHRPGRPGRRDPPVRAVRPHARGAVRAVRPLVVRPDRRRRGAGPGRQGPKLHLHRPVRAGPVARRPERDPHHRPGESAAVAEQVEAILGQRVLDEARWERLKDTELTHLAEDWIPFRKLPGEVRGWLDRGFDDDPRPDAYEGVARMDRAAFEAFLASEAARPVRWERP
jgi:predicted Zn-dependent peptidase